MFSRNLSSAPPLCFFARRMNDGSSRRRSLRLAQLMLGILGLALIGALALILYAVSYDPFDRLKPSKGGAALIQSADAGGLPPLRRTKGPNAVAGADGATAMNDGGANQAKDPALFARLGWGSGPNELGHERPQEGNPEGPMSVTLDAFGRPVILDQVNGRLVILNEDGEAARTIPVPVRAAQDVALTPDGKALVLDRLSDKTVAIMDETGRVLGELPVEGKGIEEGGGVTGVFVDGSDVYVERENASLVKIGDTDGRPDAERPEIPGRPSRDGKLFLTAGLGDGAAGKVYVTAISRETRQHLYTREYIAGLPLFGILALDTDLAGIIYLALLGEDASGGTPTPKVRLLCLTPSDGTPIGQVDLPANTLPEESFRDFAVLDEGGVIYAYRTEEGVEYRKADCR